MASPNEDDPFDLIQRGNAFASSSSHWSAADAYSRASMVLQHRADEIGNSSTSSNKMKEEEQKIKALFTTQSTEYFYKARHSLLEAMSFENEQDRVNAAQATRSGRKPEPTFSFIGREEEDRRRQIFNRLFLMQHSDCKSKAGVKAAPTEEHISALTVDSDIDIPAAPCSLLPTTDTSHNRNEMIDNDSEQRLDTIKCGLQRLGVSLPGDDGKVSSIVDKELSTEDQVKLIIQQAADEVRVEGHSDINNNQICDEDDYIDENNSMFGGYHDQIGDDFDLDTLLIKVEKMVASAAARDETVCPNSDIDNGQPAPSLECHLQMIRDAQAMLLEARLCLELERGCDNNSTRHISSTNQQREMTSTSAADSKALSSKRRDNARERIISVIRCLQHGIEEWT